MKVIAVIPVFGRLPLLKYTIKRLYEKNKVDLVICVGGTDKERYACVKEDAVFFNHPNNPLGMKWNHGFRKASEYQPDAILYVGSSDWLSDNWLPVFTPYLKDFDLIGTPDFYLADIKRKVFSLRCCHWEGYQDARKGESIGIGRMIGAGILDKIAWKPFDDRKNNSLDYQMMQKVSAAGGNVKCLSLNEVKSLSLSCDAWDNKHKFEEHWSGKLISEKVNPNEIVKEFPEVESIFDIKLNYFI